MNQQECFQQPHWVEYLGVCYPDDTLSITLRSVRDTSGAPLDFTVSNSHSAPEPSTAGLFAVALIVGAICSRIRRRP